MPVSRAALPALAAASRVAALPASRGLDLAFLVGMGAVAALAVAFVDIPWRIPGHAVLKAAIPMSLGLALAGRRFAGCLMGIGAAATGALLTSAGIVPGPGAAASLYLLGPLLDLSLVSARRGFRLHVRFAAAALVANLAAFAVRGGFKLGGIGSLGSRPWHEWLSIAPWTYAACGAAAGVLSGLLFFRLRGAPTAHAAHEGVSE